MIVLLFGSTCTDICFSLSSSSSSHLFLSRSAVEHDGKTICERSMFSHGPGSPASQPLPPHKIFPYVLVQCSDEVSISSQIPHYTVFQICGLVRHPMLGIYFNPSHTKYFSIQITVFCIHITFLSWRHKAGQEFPILFETESGHSYQLKAIGRPSLGEINLIQKQSWFVVKENRLHLSSEPPPPPSTHFTTSPLHLILSSS